MRVGAWRAGALRVGRDHHRRRAGQRDHADDRRSWLAAEPGGDPHAREGRPAIFRAEAQFRYERTVEPPVLEEGFTRVERHPFARTGRPDAAARLVAFDVDDLVAVDADRRRDVLTQLRADGWSLFAHAWRPKPVRGTASVDDVLAELGRLRDDLGLDHIAACAHDAGPPVCWCRKPLPGSLLEFALPRGVALGRSVVVGQSAADRTMAERLGITFQETGAFFGV